MSMEREYGNQLLSETIGIPIKIISNDYEEFPGMDEINNSYHRIVFQIEEDEPDIWAIGILFALSLMSFSYAASRGASAMYFQPDEEWNMIYFLQGLEYKYKCICFSADYVSGRLMKTDIKFESGGRVTITTRNRGKGADRWILHLQGKNYIKKV